MPIQLSANFGEIRKDHFHMGLDIRTKQRENLPVYAAAGGFISRISIQRYGYGKAIYIQHPNGFTTVYGHLNGYYDTLSHYIIQKQYTDKQWEQDITFSPGQFPVEKGQFIAWSGNTGSSGGPHLHFEIRDTRTGKNLNPLLFGMEVEDNIPPVLEGLYWFDRRYSTYQTSPKPIAIVNNKGSYQLKGGGDTLHIGSPRISFGVRAEDRTNSSSFLFGIYEAGLWMDDSLRCYFQVNNFSYPDSRYVNGSIDYATFLHTGKGIQHLSRLPGNELSIYNTDDNNGVISLTDTLPHTVRILLKDVEGNSTVMQYMVRYDSTLQEDLFFTMNSVAVPPNQPYNINEQEVKASFDAFAFYDIVPFVLGQQPRQQWPQASSQALLHNENVPVHDMYTVQLPLQPVAANYTDRLVMQLQSGRYRLYQKAQPASNGWFSGSFNRLGNVQLLVDTVPPSITPIGWKDNQVFTTQSSIRVRCSDNIDEVRNFNAYLDGQWILFTHSTYDYIYTFDEHCTLGEHVLSVSVQDLAGNTSVREFNFIKKEPNGNNKRRK
ncbi:membrane protein related to metalloendopeptidases [Filimonas lacunae]|nr:membrane protein related to metalloendopeptidases [Filimonas lacunae]